MIERFIQFMGKTLNSQEPQSFGRFAALITLVACLSWDTAYVVFILIHFKELQLHLTAADILPAAGALLAQGGFATLFYVGGKAGDALNRDKPPTP